MADTKGAEAGAPKETALQAPERPGVYLMKDAEGLIIYVGKAKSLKNRLSSYFSGEKDIKTRHMVARISSIEYIVVEDEYEALVLENNLIKLHSPKYNINLKDGKTYPSVRVTAEDYPRIYRTRRVIEDGSRYYGPFPSAETVDKMLELVRRLYPLRLCRKMGKRAAPCMYWHIGRCSAPCCGKISKEGYAALVRDAERVLAGDSGAIVASLRERMAAEAGALEYEKAADTRDQIAALESFKGETTASDFDPAARDYVGWAVDGTLLSFAAIRMRSGKLVGRDVFRARLFSDEEDALRGFLMTYYGKGNLPPPTVYLQAGKLRDPLVREYFKRELGVVSRLARPDERRHAAALAMAEQNAREDLARRRRESGDPRGIEDMRLALSLPRAPNRIEGFDIAHLAGKDMVSSLITFENGAPDRRGYRSFRIRGQEGRIDDFEAIREAVSRRYQRLLAEGKELPDLVMVDGGIGQVNAAHGVLEALGAEVPVVGLAKKNEEIYFPGNSTPLRLPKDSPAVRILAAVRDETHRFATKQNKRLRKKAVKMETLEAIAGVGPGRARKLMATFGSLRGIAEAAVEKGSDYVAAQAGIPLEVSKAVAEKLIELEERRKAREAKKAPEVEKLELIELDARDGGETDSKAAEPGTDYGGE
jgi:excinuclease ABC subunit C